MSLDIRLSYQGNRIFTKNNNIYVKQTWRWRAKKIMSKGDELIDRWTQEIDAKLLIGGYIPFYLVPLRKLAYSGVDIIISIVKHKHHTEELIIPINQIIDSPKKIGKGLLKQVLFDKHLLHLRT